MVSSDFSCWCLDFSLSTGTIGPFMLTISEVSKTYGPRTLFEDVSLQVNRGDRIGLVGPNGAGKTTLFSLILKQAEPDTGTVHYEKNITCGYLPQESAPAGDETVLELTTAISEEMADLQKKIKAYDTAHPDELEHHDNIHARFDELGGYQLEPKAKQILTGLAFREKDFDRPLRELSGGWVMRAHLARLLTMEPDLLILDEPTNHLDLETLGWFTEYLEHYPGAILLISHDRDFLNRLVTQILEIRQSKLIRYRGNYDDYVLQQAAAVEQQAAAYKTQQKEIAALQLFADRFRAKASKASQAQSKLKQIERMEKIEAPVNTDRKIKFNFPQPQRSGQKVITLKDINFAYGENTIYRGMEFLAERDQRTVLVGPNGAGKSTLLKILAGTVTPQSGERILGHNVKAGYYSQYRVEMLKPNNTVFEEGLDTPQQVTEEFVRTILGCFLFRGDDVFKKVSVLSGGEKSRLALVKLLLDPPNFLLMDEPTTHLDMASIDALVIALQQFQGTVVFISHDVYFIRALSNHVVRVDSGKLTHYAGNYQYYLDKSSATSARAGLTAGNNSGGLSNAQPVTAAAAAPAAPKSGHKTKEQKRFEAEQRQARSNKLKVHRELVEHLEKEIERCETRQREITAELELPGTYEKAGLAAHLNRELADISRELAHANKEWEKASAALAEADAKLG